MNESADDVEMTSRARDEERVPSVSIGGGEIRSMKQEQIKERDISTPT